MTTPDPFPLGPPVNRTEKPKLTPIPGRPNWFKDRNDHPIYVEPPRPEPEE